MANGEAKDRLRERDQRVRERQVDHARDGRLLRVSASTLRSTRIMMTSYDDVMRTIIDLPADQLEALGLLCGREGISRAEAIRRAVADLLARDRTQQSSQAFGLWRKRPLDGVKHQRRLRREWS